MKTLSLLIASAALQAGPVTYTDPDIRLQAPRGVLAQDIGSGGIDFDLSGGVTLVSKSRGINVAAPRIKGVLVPDPARKGSRRVRELTALGAFALDRVSQEKGVTRTTKIRSIGAKYVTVSGDQARVTLDAHAEIVDDKGPRKVTLTGTRGEALLRTTGEKADLEDATLIGNVRIRANVRREGVVTPYSASGDRVNLKTDPDGGSTVVMTGNLKFDAQGDSDAQITGATAATLKLNAEGEVRSVVLSTDAPGVVRTRYRSTKKGGV
ncbi:MAG: hypothetical protein C4320_08915 [Armatimonadota bacterium]